MNRFTLSGDIRISRVRLRTPDADRLLKFYGGLLGFREAKHADATAGLSATGIGPSAIVLTESSRSRPRPAQSTGLYHTAVRVPQRRDLARLLARLMSSGYPLGGAADHGVSEALYLEDPDGNGVELYWDKPREQWPWHGGQIAMVTEPLDARGLLALADLSSDEATLPAETVVGHIHLQVGDLAGAEKFYAGLLGLAVMQRSFPGALFLSAGGYHHHLGLNTWGVAGALPPPTDAAGLISFGIELSSAEAWNALRLHLASGDSAGAKVEEVSDVIRLTDPSGVIVEIFPGSGVPAGDVSSRIAFQA